MALAEAYVEILADTGRFERSLRNQLRQSGTTAGKAFNQSFQRAISKTKAGSINIGNQYGKQGTQAGQQFARNMNRTVNKSGSKTGNSFGKALLKGIISPLTGIGKILSNVMDLGSMGGKFGKGGGGGAFAALGAAAVAAAAAVAPLLGLLAAIPAAIAGAGAGIATLAVAFSGMGEALQAGFSGDMAKFQQALAGLAPSAQSVAKEIVGLKPAFDGLKASVQGAFFDPLVGQVQTLSTLVSGPLQTGMTALSGALGQAAAAMAGFFATPEAGEAIQGIFEGLATSVQAVTPGLIALTRGFLDMAAAGASSLGGIGPMMESIGAAMSQFANSGQLVQVLQQAGGAAYQLWHALQGLQPMMTALATPFGIIGQAVRSVLIPAFAAVGGVFAALAPQLQQVAAVISGVLHAVIPPAAALLVGLAQVVSAILAPAFNQLAPFLTQLTAQLGPVLLGAINQIMPSIIMLAGAIGNFLGGVLRDIMPLLQILGTALVNAFAIAAPIIAGVVQFIAGLINFIVGAMTWDFQKMKDGAAQMWEGMTGHIMEILTGLKDWIVNVGSAIINGFIEGAKSAWQAGMDFFSGIADWIRQNKGPISTDRRLLIPAGKAIMRGFHKGLLSEWGSVSKTIHGITNDLPKVAMPINTQPLPADRNPLVGPRGRERPPADQSRTTTVNAPITVRSSTGDPARVARRTADRLARLATV